MGIYNVMFVISHALQHWGIITATVHFQGKFAATPSQLSADTCFLTTLIKFDLSRKCNFKSEDNV